jgi:hypothetical protein
MRYSTILASAIFVACAGGGDSPTDAPSQSRIVGGIEYSAETLVMESFPVQLQTIVTARNTSDDDAVLHFPYPCVVAVHAYADSTRTGAPAWSQERFMGCIAVIFDDTIAAGDTAQYMAPRTDGYELLGDSLPDGRYWLMASLNPSGQRVELPAGVVDLAVPR